MDEIEKILCENLKETLKQFQTYLIWGFGSSVSFLILCLTDFKSDDIQIPIPGLFASVNSDFAKLITFAICWIAGILATYSYENAKRIVQKLHHDSNILKALLTYPSIATEIYPAVRILAAFAPGLILATGLIVELVRSEGNWKRWILVIVAIAPYFSLMLFFIIDPLTAEKAPKYKSVKGKKQ